MVALAIVLSVVVLLLAVLVAGLLRSHADILKALHDLGVGVGEPSGADGHDHAGHDHRSGRRWSAAATGPTGRRAPHHGPPAARASAARHRRRPWPG